MLISKEKTIAFSGTPIVYPFKKIMNEIIAGVQIPDVVDDKIFSISDFIRELISLNVKYHVLNNDQRELLEPGQMENLMK
jgi:hypothetical protein